MRDLLVHCADFRFRGPGARYAAELAAMLGSALTGIHVGAPIPSRAPVRTPPSLLAEFIAYAQDELQSAIRAGGAFADWARPLGVARVRWQVALGDTIEALRAASDWADALIVERRDHDDGSIATIGELLLAGVPCFAIPENLYAIGRLERIAIAYNGSPASIRALRAALPMLRRAEHVVIVRWRSPEEAGYRVSCRPEFDPAHHLHEHGIRVASEMLEDGAPDGDELLEATSRSRADLLVMGADGKRRFGQSYLDPMPGRVLRHAGIPLFMKH